MNIAAFSSECQSCTNRFEIPVLSDFSYGKFIAKGKSGKTFAYLNAIEHETEWDSIEEIYNEICELDAKLIKNTDAFQYLVGRCMNRVNGEELSIIRKWVCPECQSEDVRVELGEAVGLMNMEDVSFSEFLSVSEDGKRKLLRQYLQEYVP